MYLRSHGSKTHLMWSKTLRSLPFIVFPRRGELVGEFRPAGARLVEGANINRSLLALANCINALAQDVSETATLMAMQKKEGPFFSMVSLLP